MDLTLLSLSIKVFEFDLSLSLCTLLTGILSSYGWSWRTPVEIQFKVLDSSAFQFLFCFVFVCFLRSLFGILTRSKTRCF